MEDLLEVGTNLEGQLLEDHAKLHNVEEEY